MMDEMAKTLARRRAIAEKKDPSNNVFSLTIHSIFSFLSSGKAIFCATKSSINSINLHD